MSSKRGRKRNDNLPPNRARDVQRAFRERRAAHLQAMEQRVAELEVENDCLRRALNLPPASRSPLGRGPTGKDMPKAYVPDASSGDTGTALPHPSRDSSSSSRGSTRASSLSPGTLTLPRSVSDIDGGPWDTSMVMEEQHSDVPSSSASSTYPLPSLNSQSTSRSTMPGNAYIPTQSGFSQSADRMSSSYSNNSGFVMRDESDIKIRDPRS
ncbi:uncharacterized protein BT62DRAFT_1001841 [Guyanagaster necrorhizus]|uniref:BZIP domain-containing protein n=1 Tax=Guyanagaster necrorhizus TaxID=856835 RepID=A0A9P7W011_9AGAR|nr:uncharacterized protein BT62DRAFT_1001841 [Guyanagaster necrorhizus MCA 3950]KAG7449550.1 hypothetical protein BT62DRAFT_1001841 [Guyanagaster necrorhizus MCA 3950]